MKLRNWQVVIGFIVFVIIYGLAGTSDRHSQHIMTEQDKIICRDNIRLHVESEEKAALLHYNQIARGEK